MKNHFVKVSLMLIFFLTNIYLFANDIKLPSPDKSNKTSLITALENRKSDRNFSDKEIDNQTLSNILWVAYGVNRSDGKRTIPTAKNNLDLDIYIFNKKGIFLYDAINNLLIEKSKKNYLNLFNLQDYMKNVSTILVYVGSNEDYSLMHAGSSYQNVELFTAANNMASIVRGYYNREKVTVALNLPKNKRVLITQAIGYKK